MRHPGEIPALTMTRFVAAFAVVWYHYGRADIPAGAIHNIIASSYSGVSFFFILSGFVLTYVYHAKPVLQRDQLPEFYIRRVARIYPVYVFAWAMFGVGVLLETLNSDARAYFAKTSVVFGGLSLGLIQAWIPAAPQHWNWPGWSLSVEAVFYAVFPFVLVAANRLPTRVVGWWVVAAILANAVIDGAIGSSLNTHILVGSILETQLSDYIQHSPIPNLPLFIIGVGIGSLYVRGKRFQRPALCLSLVSVAIVLTLASASGPDAHVGILRRDMLLAPEFAVLIYLLAVVRGAADGWLGRTGLLLGRSSYALYIIQAPLWNLTWWVLNHGIRLHSLTIVSLFSIFAALVSVSVHLYVEVPAERAIKRWWISRRNRYGVTALVW